jgi:hypothetical protein
MKMKVFRNAMAFLGALLVAIGGWAEAFDTWVEAFQMNHLGSLGVVVGGVLIAYFTKRPQDSNK